jgi:hypothetical protein
MAVWTVAGSQPMKYQPIKNYMRDINASLILGETHPVAII